MEISRAGEYLFFLCSHFWSKNMLKIIKKFFRFFFIAVCPVTIEFLSVGGIVGVVKDFFDDIQNA